MVPSSLLFFSLGTLQTPLVELRAAATPSGIYISIHSRRIGTRVAEARLYGESFCTFAGDVFRGGGGTCGSHLSALTSDRVSHAAGTGWGARHTRTYLATTPGPAQFPHGATVARTSSSDSMARAVHLPHLTPHPPSPPSTRLLIFHPPHRRRKRRQTCAAL